MRKLFACALACAFFLVPTVSFAGNYHHFVPYRPHHVYKPPVKPPTPANPTGSRGGGSWAGVTHGLYILGASCLASHLAQFIAIGVKEGRPRTDKEMEMVIVACTLGLYYPIWH